MIKIFNTLFNTKHLIIYKHLLTLIGIRKETYYMARIELKHMFKDYIPNVHAVTDFNLVIEDKEFIVLVGPSGCGKSTTLRMVAGLEDITSGELIIDGILENNNHPKDRDIAMVFQNYALYPHMSVRENMAFGLKMQKLNEKEIQSRVNNAAEILGLQDYLERKPKELSGGQRQRVALGRAIVRNAKLFLMDEPLSNLDAKLRVQTRAEISKLHKKLGTTTMYVTHDQTEAMTMATRIVVMKDGFIQQVGTPKEVYLYPANYFVASFIGSPAMNFIHAIVEQDYLLLNNGLKIKIKNFVKQLINAGYKDKEIILGMRPENMMLYKDIIHHDKIFKFTSTVTISEMLGSETLVHFNLGENNMIAKIASMDEFNVDTTVEFGINVDHIHCFNIENELRISLKGNNDE